MQSFESVPGGEDKSSENAERAKAPARLAEDLSGQEKFSSAKTPKEVLLESREKSSSRELGGGANETLFVDLRDDGSVVFKPESGSDVYISGRLDIKPETLPKRERAAYLVSRFLGFDFVPPTVLRDIDGRHGSAQEFIPDSKTFDHLDIREFRSLPVASLVKLWIFDYIIWNLDRHKGNILYRNGDIIAIDHGFSFAGKANYYPYGRHFNTAVPGEVIASLERFRRWSQGKAILLDLLKELLPADEAEACLFRIDRLTDLAENGSIPDVKREEMVFSANEEDEKS